MIRVCVVRNVLASVLVVFIFFVLAPCAAAESGSEIVVVRVDPQAPPGGDGLTWATAYNSIQDAVFHLGWSPDEELHIWLTGETREFVWYGDGYLDPRRIRFMGGFAGHESAPDERDADAPHFVWRGAPGWWGGETCFFDLGHDAHERVGFERIHFADAHYAIDQYQTYEHRYSIDECRFTNVDGAVRFVNEHGGFAPSLSVSRSTFEDVHWKAIDWIVIEAGATVDVTASRFDRVGGALRLIGEAFNRDGIVSARFVRSRVVSAGRGVRVVGRNGSESSASEFEVDTIIESSLFVDVSRPVELRYASRHPERALDDRFDTMSLRIVGNTFVGAGASAIDSEASWYLGASEPPPGVAPLLPQTIDIDVWNNAFVDVEGRVLVERQQEGLGAGTLVDWRVTSNSSFDAGAAMERLDGSVFSSMAELNGLAFADGNFEADPEFVAPALGDFRLLVSSPLVDAGDPAALYEELLDLLGQPRVEDGDGDTLELPDIGALERPASAGR